MAIQRTPLQGISPSAPRQEPYRESFGEFAKKAAFQAGLQGLVQVGANAAVEYLTDDLKTNRQIKVAEAEIKARAVSGRETSARSDLRDLEDDTIERLGETDKDMAEARKWESAMERSNMQRSVGESDKVSPETTKFLDNIMEDYNVKAKEVDANNALIAKQQAKNQELTQKANALRAKGDAESLKQAADLDEQKKNNGAQLQKLEARNAYLGEFMPVLKQMRDLSQTVQTSGWRDARTAAAKLNRLVQERVAGLKGRRQMIMRSWREKAFLLANDVPGLAINSRALDARIESMESRYAAANADVQLRKRLLGLMGAKRYNDWEASGGFSNTDWDISRELKIAADPQFDRTRFAEFKHHFPMHLRKLYALDDVNTVGTKEYLKERYIVEAGVVDPKTLTVEDKIERSTVRAVAGRIADDIDPEVMESVWRNPASNPQADFALKDDALMSEVYGRNMPTGPTGETGEAVAQMTSDRAPSVTGAGDFAGGQGLERRSAARGGEAIGGFQRGRAAQGLPPQQMVREGYRKRLDVLSQADQAKSLLPKDQWGNYLAGSEESSVLFYLED